MDGSQPNDEDQDEQRLAVDDGRPRADDPQSRMRAKIASNLLSHPFIGLPFQVVVIVIVV